MKRDGLQVRVLSVVKGRYTHVNSRVSILIVETLERRE
jgi:hypothetical protein